MRVLAVVAAAIGLFAVGLVGFGHLLEAWDPPAGAGAARNGNHTATERGTTSTNTDEQEDQQATQQRRSARERVPAAVARRVDLLCRSAREDALSLVDLAPPTNAKRLEALFVRLRQLNRNYNAAILRILGKHGAHARFRTLRRLFHRDEKLFDQLVGAIADIDSAAGRAVFESRLESLRLLAARQTAILEELGTQACDTALTHT